MSCTCACAYDRVTVPTIESASLCRVTSYGISANEEGRPVPRYICMIIYIHVCTHVCISPQRPSCIGSDQDRLKLRPGQAQAGPGLGKSSTVEYSSSYLQLTYDQPMCLGHLTCNKLTN